MHDFFNINLIWALLCLFLLVFSLVLNASGAPGNWIMHLVAGLYSILIPSESPYGLGLFVLGITLILAIIGEVLEFLTGAISSKKAGASRRGVWYSLIGSVIGSFLGIFVGIPVPIIGSLIAALIFSALGAFLGAYYAEKLEGQYSKTAWKIGVSSFIGRILGSLFKTTCGFLALICITMGMVL